MIGLATIGILIAIANGIKVPNSCWFVLGVWAVLEVLSLAYRIMQDGDEE